MDKEPFVLPNESAYLPGIYAAMVIADSKSLFAKPDAEPFALSGEEFKKYRKVVPWGEDNDLPQQVIAKVDKSPDLSTGLLFNVKAGFGEGIMPCRYEYDDKGVKSVIPVTDNEEINTFFEHNDINGYLLEQLTDINFFFNVFPEIILNQEKSETRKVVEITSKEATFSRWESADPKTGLIENHFYSAVWAESTPKEGEVVASKVLHPKHPIRDIMIKMGRIENNSGKKKDEQCYRYIIPVSFPSPGRSYYQKPAWYSIITSGWYDFAVAIPEFKKALIQNGMTIRYVIKLEEQYFPDMMKREGITEEKAIKARVKKEYDDLNKYLTGVTNSGKSLVTFFKAFPDGKKVYRIEIEALTNDFKGGEYLNDSSEVSNMIAYTLETHPSIIGASPGKNSSFSGSDKRELFIIKQALLKPIRDRLLRPIYLVKAVNKWPDDIHFIIPNIELVTLDKNKSGVETKAE